MEIKRVSESSKRNIKTVSPASSGSHDGDELKVKKHKKESCSSLSSEIECVEEKDKDRELNDRVSDESEEKDKDYEFTDSDSDKKFLFHIAKGVADDLVAYYNDETKNHKDTMEVIKIKEAIGSYVDPYEVYFICVEAKFTPKDEKKTRITHCRSVLFVNSDLDVHPWGKVLRFKCGPLKDEYIKKWTEKHASPGRRVLYSEFTKEKDAAPPMDQTHTDNKEEEEVEDVDTNNDNEDGSVKLSKREALKDMHCGWGKEKICPRIEEFASVAVAYYNDKEEGSTMMKLVEITEALGIASFVEVYHINFDAVLLDNDGEEIKQTSYQAVVSEEPSGLMKVWFLKEADGKDEWCKELDCVCDFPPLQLPTREEVLKSMFPDWCLSSDDEGDQEKEAESSNLPPPASTHLENQGLLFPVLLMEIKRVSESSKRNIETVSPASSGSHDDDELKVKKHKKEISSSFSSEEKEKDSSDHRESTETKKETDSYTEEDGGLSAAEDIVYEVETYYNDDAGNEDMLEVVRVKEAIGAYEPPDQIYFICFEAKLTTKDGKQTKKTGRSVIFINPYTAGPVVEVVSFKLGSLRDEDIKKWTEKNADPRRRVLYSESMKKTGTAPPMGRTHSDNKEGEKDIDTDCDGASDDSIKLPDSKEVFEFANKDPKEINFGLSKVAEICHRIVEFAGAAVAYYNDELRKGGAMMKLGKIKEAFTQACPGEQYHINFDSLWLDKDGKETKATSFQAVVLKERSCPLKVCFLREGNGKDEWCKERRCVCEYPPLQQLSRKQLLESKYPEWCISSDDEEEEEGKKMMPKSSNQPPASSHLENQGITQN